jgi:putative sterol carrier protein
MKKSEEYLAELVQRFRPEAAQGLEAVYELRLSGDGGGTWHMVVLDQTCQILEGAAPEPTTIISLSSQDWQALIAGKMDAFTALLQGKLTVHGDMNLATRLPGLFGM